MRRSKEISIYHLISPPLISGVDRAMGQLHPKAGRGLWPTVAPVPKGLGDPQGP